MYTEQISGFIDSHADEMKQTLIRLMKIPSVKSAKKDNMPYGEKVFEALECIESIATELGFETENFENRISAVSMDNKPKNLGILCHMDVVAASSDGWRTPPFEPKTEGNWIYGRGAYDNKGAAVAALYAMYAVKELNIPRVCGAGLYFGTDEESGGDDLMRYLKTHTLPEYIFVPDSHFPVCVAEEGLIRIYAEERVCSDKIISASSGTQVNIIPAEAEAVIKREFAEDAETILSKIDGIEYRIEKSDDKAVVKIFGKSAHASRPAAGVNAATALIKMLAHIDEKAFGELARLFGCGMYYGEGFGLSKEHLTLSLTILKYKGGCLTFETDSRVALTKSSERLAKQITEQLPQEAKITLLKEPHSVSEEAYIVKTLTDIYKKHTGRDDKPYTMSGLTYAHDIEGAVVFGAVLPEDGSGGAHGADEHFNLNTMTEAAKMFAKAIVEICNGR